MKGRIAGTAGALLLAVLAANQPSPHPLGLLDTLPPPAPPIELRYAAEGREPLAGLTARFRWGSMPPVLNQGDTPRCVAYSVSAVKAWQDRLEWGRFFNFDEVKFAGQIGTTAVGAYMSRALVQVDDYGYPVVNVGQRSKHRIRSYWSVPVNAADIKRAVAEYGPVLVIGYWYNEWWKTQANGVLREPRTVAGGHAYVVYGWDNDRGLRIRNSWGTGWGIDGDGYLPYRYVTSQHIYGVYVTLDEITPKTAEPTPVITPPITSPEVTPTAEPSAVPTATLDVAPTPPTPTVRPGTSSSPAATAPPEPEPEPPNTERDPAPLLFLAILAFGIVSAYVLLRKP